MKYLILLVLIFSCTEPICTCKKWNFEPYHVLTNVEDVPCQPEESVKLGDGYFYNIICD
jgi:hypothetical protein